MIALAVAALLTLAALAIWAGRVARRPVDWEGPLTTGPTLRALQDTVNLRLAQLLAHRAAFGQAHAIVTLPDEDHHWVDITPFAIDPVITPGRPSSALNRALRASERDDRRKEGR